MSKVKQIKIPIKTIRAENSEHFLILCEDDWYRYFSGLELELLGMSQDDDELQRVDTARDSERDR